MILSELKQYLQKNRRVALRDVALYLKAEPDAVRGMLEQWVRKGKVKKLEGKGGCGGGCCKCDEAMIEAYEWLSDRGHGKNLEVVNEN